MKKLLAAALAGVCLLTLLAVFAPPVQGRDVRECYVNHDVCRQQAFRMDVGWVKMTLYLTACDLAFGRCIWYA